MEEMKSGDSLGRSTRRTFLRNAGLATAGVLVAEVARSSRYSVANARVLGANDSINWGIIGCGSMGMNHVRSIMDQAAQKESNCQFVAACDIWEPRKEAAKAKMTGAKIYHEYEKLLADPNVDVVMIAVPEHWHAKMAMDAMEAGKDVYLEKPMARHIDEATKMMEVVRRTKRVLQVGAQWTQEPKWRKAHELLPQLGKVVWSQTSYCRNTPSGEWNIPPIDPACTPQTLDWKRWLGPAPQHEFSPERYFHWRKYWDYSSGICGDLFPHRVTTLMLALGTELPARVACTGGIFASKPGDREVPDTMNMLVDFPSGHTMFVAGSTVNENGPGAMIRGTKANMNLESGSRIEIKPERPYAEEVDPSQETVEIIDDPMRNHEKDFMACVRSRKDPTCGPDLAYASMVVVGMGEISCRESKMLRWDAEKKTVI